MSDSLAHLQDQDLWIHWPIQTVMKPNPPHLSDCGIVVAGRLSVYELNLFDLKGGLIAPQLEGVSHTDYESYEAMLADGWEVD